MGEKLEVQNGGSSMTRKEHGELQVPEIRRVQRTDLKYILNWLSDPETRKHLSPLDEVKDIPQSEAGRMDAIAHLADYYFDNRGKPQKIGPLVALDGQKTPLGAVTMRWSEDPYIGDRPRTAGLERLVVDPKLRRRGVGTSLIKRALEIAFSEGEGAPYKGRGADEVRLWVMARKGGEMVPDYHQNIEFFRGFGFRTVPGDPEWGAYAKKKGLPIDEGDEAYWMMLPREEYKARLVNSAK